MYLSTSLTEFFGSIHEILNQPENQIAVALWHRGRLDQPLAQVARRVGIGDVVAGDLEAELRGGQRVGGKLDGAEERHDRGADSPYAS